MTLKVAFVYVMIAYGEMNIQLQWFLTSALDGGEGSAWRPGRFRHGESSPVPIVYPGGPQGRVHTSREEINILSLPGIEHRLLCGTTSSLVSVLIDIFLIHSVK
jgi:hypothetical protein